MVFGIILIIGVLGIPESPRSLLKHGQEHEAAEIMGRLHSLPSDDAQIREDIEEINKFNAITQGRKLSWRVAVGWPGVTWDAIFAEAHAKGKNPVFTERRYRESGGKPIAIAKSSDGDGVQDEKEKENGVVEDV
ncbi:hypothetical protein LTR27_011959 [Elasticomyces elasticus]|nr:hypothetical protein LTR27_011959 [Elasticomyces elasticus]